MRELLNDLIGSPLNEAITLSQKYECEIEFFPKGEQFEKVKDKVNAIIDDGLVVTAFWGN